MVKTNTILKTYHFFAFFVLYYYVILNELYRKINNNTIRDNHTTCFVLTRTHQAGIVARNRCCDLKQAGLSTKH